MDPRTKSIASASLFVVAILVVAAYTITSAWTGFRGNTVWHRLGLVVLPVTLLPGGAAQWQVYVAALTVGLVSPGTVTTM
jgi:hypothetical protein